MNLRDLFLAMNLSGGSGGSGGGNYTLPVASPTVLGGVKPAAKSDDMTEPVGVDASGKLFTKPGGGGGWKLLDEVTLEEDAVPYLDLGATLPHFEKIRITATIPAMEESVSLTFYFTNLDTSSGLGYGLSYQVGTYTGTGNQTCIVEFEPVIVKDREFLFVRTYTIGGTLTNSANWTGYDHSRILTARWFFSKQSWPAGSNIKLEGVAA